MTSQIPPPQYLANEKNIEWHGKPTHLQSYYMGIMQTSLLMCHTSSWSRKCRPVARISGLIPIFLIFILKGRQMESGPF